MGTARLIFLFAWLLATSASSQDIKPYQAQTVQPAQPAQTVKPYQAQAVQPVQPAQTVKPYQAQTIKPYQAETIRPYQAQTIKPDQAPSVQPVRPAQIVQPMPTPPAEQRQAAQQQLGGGSVAALLGLWQTNIPGVAYTTPSGRPGYDILHVSSGASGGLFKLNRDGTYSWNSYGGKRGKWVQTGRADYPVEIMDTVENRRWLVGLDSRTGEITLWSGSIWYKGRRAALK